MSNIEVARGIMQSLWQAGVRDIVLCAGARNAPFVASLSVGTPFAVHSFFEERSAAFFALGRILRDMRPVAVITTSGTAAANLLPAAIEADYQGQPLILITADRPAHYRGSGAPQTINQIGLYSHYVEKSWDVQGAWTESLTWSRRRPLHLNVCFDEPLLDAKIEPLRIEAKDEGEEIELASSPCSLHRVPPGLPGRAPLVIAGGVPALAREGIARKLQQWNRPVLCEAPSGLRGHSALSEIEIFAPDKTLKAIAFDSVIRIGSVPTHRVWRDLEKAQVPVTHFSDLPFSGLPRERAVHPLAALTDAGGAFTPWSADERARDRRAAATERDLLLKYPFSEPAWVAWLSRQMPGESCVFLGNSLPIREWDFAAARNCRFEIFANRGANGIDGLISTFLGLASPKKSNWCVIGDLSAMYDLSGPWPNRRENLRDLNLVILNNSGGKIFKRLFHNPLFENPHDLNFKTWAQMWGWSYECLREPRSLAPNSGPRVIEIVPDETATENFWDEWGKTE